MTLNEIVTDLRLNQDDKSGHIEEVKQEEEKSTEQAELTTASTNEAIKRKTSGDDQYLSGRHQMSTTGGLQHRVMYYLIG